jgi:hypothetical protein
MGVPSTGLVKWLTRMLSDITEEGTISRLELAHVIEGEHAERLELWRNKSDEARDPQELAQEIQDRAEDDVQSRITGQPQRYVVYAFRGDADIHESQHGFLVRPRSVRHGDDSEPPNERGIVGQSMRHNEGMHRLLLNGCEALVGRLAADLDRERTARVKAEELNWSMHDRYQQLLDKEHERRLAEAKELMKARRMDELLGVATALLPIVITKVVGGAAAQAPAQLSAVVPELVPVDPKDAAIRHFFASLSEEEISGVLGSLSSTNQVALAELHRAFGEPAPGPADVAARQLAARKFLKALSEQETRGVFASLTAENRDRLIELYSQYREIEEAEQNSKPEILRS